MIWQKYGAIQNVRHVTQERGKGRMTKHVMLLTQKTEILRVTFFLNDPYGADLFCCVFMSVFVDGVISFL